MHIGMRLRPNGHRFCHLVSSACDTYFTAPHRRGVGLDIRIAAPKVDDVWVDGIDCDRKVILALAEAMVIHWQHVRNVDHFFPGTARPIQAIKPVGGTALTFCDESIQQVGIVPLHAERDPTNIVHRKGGTRGRPGRPAVVGKENARNQLRDW